MALATPLDVLPIGNMTYDMHKYVQNISNKLKAIRQTVKEDATKAKDQMVKRFNQNSKPLIPEEGDYVYLNEALSGRGSKL